MNSIGIEPCISISNWDKQSTWGGLIKKIEIKSWTQILRKKKQEQQALQDKGKVKDDGNQRM